MFERVVMIYKDYMIHQRSLNHFACSALLLYGYESLPALKRAITLKINQQAQKHFPKEF